MKININELPKVQSSIKDEVKFRGSLSSGDYNTLQEDIFFDLGNMFNLVNSFDQTLIETSECSVIDNTYTQMRLNSLEAMNLKLQTEVESLKSTGMKRKFLFPVDMNNNKDSEYPAHINKQYDQVNIRAYSTISKLYLYDKLTGTVTIPDTLKVNIEPKADESTIIDSNFNNAFNGVVNEYWYRKVINNNMDTAVATIEITLPDDIISNRDVNTIELSPFPYGSLEVMAIEHQLNGNWEIAPGFKSHKNAVVRKYKDNYNNNAEEIYVKNAENIKLNFRNTAMSKVRITLRQKSYVEEQGNRVFYLGLKSLNISCDIVSDEYCEFYSEIEFPDAQDIPKMVTGIIPNFNNAHALSDSSTDKKSLISYEFYSINEYGEREYVKNTFPILVDKNKYHLVARVHYDVISNTNPALHTLEVLYNDVSI